MSDGSLVDVLQQIDAILNTFPIDEVGIVVGSEVPIVHVDTKLGLAHTLVKPMLRHVLERVYQLDKQLGSDSSVLSGLSQDINSASRMVLLIKGDYPLAFKMRKLLIESDLVSIASEIALLMLVFGRTPKTPSGWHHRRWCLERNTEKRGRGTLTASEVESEREVCRKFAEVSPKNYYCWMHRLWLLNHMTKLQLVDEMAYTQDWLLTHVSDHSAVSHRMQTVFTIASLLLNQESCPVEFMELLGHEYPSQLARVLSWIARCLLTSEELISTRPGHEALWYHRRSLVVMLLLLLQRVFQQVWPRVDAKDLDALPTAEGTLSPVGPDAEHVVTAEFAFIETFSDTHAVTRSTIVEFLRQLLTREVCLCRRFIANEADVWDYAAQRAMALRYSAFVLDRVGHCISDKVQSEDRRLLLLVRSLEIEQPVAKDEGDFESVHLARVCRDSLSEVNRVLMETAVVLRL